MVTPRRAKVPFDCRYSSSETVRGIVLGEYQNRPPGRLEGFVAPSITQSLGLKKMVAAVVLDCKAPVTVAQVGRRGSRIIRSKCYLQVRFWQVRVKHGQPQHRFRCGISTDPHQLQGFPGTHDPLKIGVPAD
jgi:hypothetical protein